MGTSFSDGNLLTRSPGSSCDRADFKPFVAWLIASTMSPLTKPTKLPVLSCFSNNSLAACSVNPSGVVISNFCPVGALNENFGIAIFIGQSATGSELPVDLGLVAGSSVSATIFTPLGTASAVGGGVGVPSLSAVVASVPLL